jgi:hypothetical protein
LIEYKNEYNLILACPGLKLNRTMKDMDKLEIAKQMIYRKKNEEKNPCMTKKKENYVKKNITN